MHRLDIFRPLLRGGEPIQVVADIFGQGGRHVQGEEETRDATTRICNC